MSTSSSSISSIAIDVETQPRLPQEQQQQKKKPQQQQQLQSRVCEEEEVSLLVKIFAALLLLVLATSIITSPAGRNSWKWSRRGPPEELLPYEPPAELMHNMTDGDLFRLVLEANRSNRLRYRLTPKVAFLFLTRGPLPLLPLWEKYFQGHDGRFSIYIHTHPAYQPVNSSTPSVFHKRHIPSQVLSWGSMSMVDAQRRLLENALLVLSNERFILLSESCIPLFNFSFAYDYLMESRYSFVDDFDNPDPAARGRYNRKLQPEINITEWRKGAQWFEMSRKVAVLILNETKYFVKFEGIPQELELRNPEEHYIPTVLYILAPKVIAYRTLTWAVWKGGPHPVTFGKDEISGELLRKINLENNCTYNDQPSTSCLLVCQKVCSECVGASHGARPQFPWIWVGQNKAQCIS